MEEGKEENEEEEGKGLLAKEVEVVVLGEKEATPSVVVEEAGEEKEEPPNDKLRGARAGAAAGALTLKELVEEKEKGVGEAAKGEKGVGAEGKGMLKPGEASFMLASRTAFSIERVRCCSSCVWCWSITS